MANDLLRGVSQMLGFLFGLWLGGLLVTLVTVRTENEDGTPLSGTEYLDPSVFLPIIFWPVLISLIAIRTFAEGGNDPHDFPFV